MESIYVSVESNESKGLYSVEQAINITNGNPTIKVIYLGVSPLFEVAEKAEDCPATMLFAAYDNLDKYAAYCIRRGFDDAYFLAEEAKDKIINVLK